MNVDEVRTDIQRTFGLVQSPALVESDRGAI